MTVHKCARQALADVVSLPSYSAKTTLPMTLEGPKHPARENLAGGWNESRVESTHRFRETIHRIFSSYTREINNSGLPDKHKQIILADLKQLEDSYATSERWDAAPESAFEIEHSRKHRASRRVKYGTDLL
jgi:hypothetical protein